MGTAVPLERRMLTYAAARMLRMESVPPVEIYPRRY
jgi:hypothetical protein